jgi:hypothetical protein
MGVGLVMDVVVRAALVMNYTSAALAAPSRYTIEESNGEK